MGVIINIFKLPELRKRVLFTLAMLAVYRFGVFVACPGVDRTVMDKVTVSRAARGLSARRLIGRSENRADGRSHVLTLTEEGRRLHAEIAPLALAYEAALICGLAPAEVAQLKRLLARLQHAAGTLAGGAAPLADPGLTGL